VTDKEHSKDGKWYQEEVCGEYCDERYDSHDEEVCRMDDKGIVNMTINITVNIVKRCN
jgi:hypothetical protein